MVLDEIREAVIVHVLVAFHRHPLRCNDGGLEVCEIHNLPAFLAEVFYFGFEPFIIRGSARGVDADCVI